MKNGIYVLFLTVVVSGVVFAGSMLKKEPAPLPTPVQLSAAEKEAAIKQWETTPGGIAYKSWAASAGGQKVYASEAKVRKQVAASTGIEAVVTSLSLPPGSRLGFGLMVRIKGDDYLLAFGPGKASELQGLQQLKTGDRIVIRSHALSHAPKYAYPILWLNHVERDGKLMYKRVPPKGGC